MSISNYAENKLLDTLRNVSFAVATVYVRLHTGDPGENGTNNNAGEGSRQTVTFAAAANGALVSNSNVTWSTVSTSETLAGVSLWDAAGTGSPPTGGNCLGAGTFTGIAVTAGQQFQILSGGLTVTLD